MAVCQFEGPAQEPYSVFSVHNHPLSTFNRNPLADLQSLGFPFEELDINDKFNAIGGCAVARLTLHKFFKDNPDLSSKQNQVLTAVQNCLLEIIGLDILVEHKSEFDKGLVEEIRFHILDQYENAPYAQKALNQMIFGMRHETKSAKANLDSESYSYYATLSNGYHFIAKVFLMAIEDNYSLTPEDIKYIKTANQLLRYKTDLAKLRYEISKGDENIITIYSKANDYTIEEAVNEIRIKIFQMEEYIRDNHSNVNTNLFEFTRIFLNYSDKLLHISKPLFNIMAL